MLILVKAIGVAFRTVFFTLILLLVVIYVFAIIFTGSFSDRESYPLTPYCSKCGDCDDCLLDGDFGGLGQDYMATMGDSFMTLFTRGVLGDNLDETVDAVLSEGGVWLMWAYFIFFAITFATLLNMLIGVICEVIQDAAEEEERNDNETLLRNCIGDAFDEIDLNSDGVVSKKEWAQVKMNPRVRSTLSRLGLEEERMDERLEQMSSFLFLEKDVDEDGEETGLTIDQLTKKVVQMRPDADASALDLELMKSQVVKDQKLFKAKLRRMQLLLKKYLYEQTGVNRTTKAPSKSR